jgi:hypothetical protein
MYADRPKIYKRFFVYDREEHYLMGIARNVCNALNKNEQTIRSLENILRQAKVTLSLRKPIEGVKV